jgi:hypothetical protein
MDYDIHFPPLSASTSQAVALERKNEKQKKQQVASRPPRPQIKARRRRHKKEQIQPQEDDDDDDDTLMIWNERELYLDYPTIYCPLCGCCWRPDGSCACYKG